MDLDSAPNSLSTVVVVTEEMVTEAARAGDLEQLQEWARQGVRVASAEPLLAAVMGSSVEVAMCLVLELGADVNQPMPKPALALGTRTVLFRAAAHSKSEMVECLVGLGADVRIANNRGGYTALHESSLQAHCSMMQCLLEHTDATMEEVSNSGETSWDLLLDSMKHISEMGEIEKHTAALTALLRVLVLRGALPPDLEALLERVQLQAPEPARVVHEGARLRARLPAYLLRRQALLDAHCAVLLPPLRDLVHGYMELTTTEKLWATGLGTAP
jgi:hypothetical protein